LNEFTLVMFLTFETTAVGLTVLLMLLEQHYGSSCN